MVTKRDVMPLPAHLIPENRWEFDVPIDEAGTLATFSLPKLEYINPDSDAGKRAIEASKLKLTVAQQYDLVRELAVMLNSDLTEVIPKLDPSQIGWLSDKWTESSAVAIPESSASASSSPTTEGPSKPTSSTKASASAGSAKRTSRSATSSRSSSTSRAKARSSGS
ncbi:hypothetical protein CH296_00380 [Rhodococcus sp. 14-2496-1d]|uniref:hypothetical protein n=1 Tax=Rhodococcus sp. 14-2496-1d TaxID=2023146 RepID=UPI000B9BAFE3|nr:hypothetical protein [Rhodococcus sp. 14-2496-1d]OZF40748.1 hypothetical protein CH296_00380 [Rhodococcus sp. 14-2496-1d]